MNSTAKVSTNPTQCALVPVEATEEMYRAAGTCGGGPKEQVERAIAAAPHAGKVSREQFDALCKAFKCLCDGGWCEEDTISLIIMALGLTVEGGFPNEIENHKVLEAARTLGLSIQEEE